MQENIIPRAQCVRGVYGDRRGLAGDKSLHASLPVLGYKQGGLMDQSHTDPPASPVPKKGNMLRERVLRNASLYTKYTSLFLLSMPLIS